MDDNGDNDDWDDDETWANVDVDDGAAQQQQPDDDAMAQWQAPRDEVVTVTVDGTTVVRRAHTPEERQRLAEARTHRLWLRHAHLLGLVAHGMVRMRLCGSDSALQDRCVALVPAQIRNLFAHPTSADRRRRSVQVSKPWLHLLTQWWKGEFAVVTCESTVANAVLPRDALLTAVDTRHGSNEVKVELFACICKALGLRTRVVRSLWPISLLRRERNSLSKTPSSTPPRTTLTRAKSAPPIAADANDSTAVQAPPPLFWVELFWFEENRWLAVDCIRGVLDRPDTFDTNEPHPMIYAVAFENKRADGRVAVKDVTRRYTTRWATFTRKLRGPDDAWWRETMTMLERPPDDSDDEDGARWEDAELISLEANERMPTTMDQFRSHPTYALERHIKKYEVIHPRTVIGHFKGEPIFPRQSVRLLHTKEAWLKQGRVIMTDEVPIKIVTSIQRSRSLNSGRRRRRSKSDDEEESTAQANDTSADQAENTTEAPLFGEWQTEQYRAEPARDGKVPRNTFNNVDLYQPWMLPPGTVHLKQLGLWQLAKRLEIDYADAVVGFEFKKNRTIPVKHGIVVCAEFESALIAAWDENERYKVERELCAREKTACLRWLRLARGILMAHKLSNNNYAMMTATSRPPTASSVVASSSSTPTLAHTLGSLNHEHRWVRRYDDLSETVKYVCACGATNAPEQAAFGSGDDRDDDDDDDEGESPDQTSQQPSPPSKRKLLLSHVGTRKLMKRSSSLSSIQSDTSDNDGGH